ncbi:hypothetical protein NX784_14855 [Massilia pinisoli]|uniref:Uncharacterized protein n=1 Tax=Massilia pinisoli TaxID=1772194 RepID=A0ABT1ZSL1_9BURK|nr:hypothetical protein [Massilia pinisoli]MCS0582869.1 hypothetical protein [Massilia pinisoli]
MLQMTYVRMGLSPANSRRQRCTGWSGGKAYALALDDLLYCICIQYFIGATMRIRMVKMFEGGVELEKRKLHDRYTRVYRGRLTISDVTHQGRHRPSKVARLVGDYDSTCELYDVMLVWLNDSRMTLTGDERILNEQGKTVCYKQSWLCLIDTDN